MGATSYALGSGGFNLGFEMRTSTNVFVPGVSFAGIWEIGTFSTDVWEFRTATSLASVGELGVRASIVDVDALGGSASLEDGWKIWSETPLVGDGGLGAGASVADVWRIGVETSLACVLRIGAATSLVGVGGPANGTSLGDMRSFGAAMSLSGSWRGTKTHVAWRVIGTDGPSPFAADMGGPDNAKTRLGLCIKHNASRCKSASTSSALSPRRSVV